MPPNDDTDRLRALVNAAPVVPPEKARRQLRWRRVLRMAGIGLAALVVLGSVVVAGLIVASELSDDAPETALRTGSDPAATVVAPTVAPTTVATVESVTTGSDTGIASTRSSDIFRQLRYLPAGAVRDMELHSIHRLPEAAPLAVFTRTERGDRVTAIVFIDSVPDALVDGVGVPELAELDVNGVSGVIAATGPELSHVILWRHPTLGPLRAWGIGMTSAEQGSIVDQLVAGLGDSSNNELLPEGWERVVSHEQAQLQPVWRAYYLGQDGETAAITTSASSGNAVSLDCAVDAEPNSSCGNIDVHTDEDGVEILLVASQARLGDLRSQLRPTTASNARIRSTELEPMAAVPISDAASLLYVPRAISDWQILETLSYSSSRPISEPVLVLLERETPEIGAIVSAAVVQVAPDDPLSSNSGGNDSAPSSDDNQVAQLLAAVAGAQYDARLLTTIAGTQYELLGWKYLPLELALIDRLLSVDDTGLRYASRAQLSVGLERQYDDIIANPIPRVITEGTVFSAQLVNNAGEESTVRVSHVPGYVPEAAAVLRHDNDEVIALVRGKRAALIVSGDFATLAWEEQPGVLISLSGSSDAELLRLADSLELVRASDLADVDQAG